MSGIMLGIKVYVGRYVRCREVRTGGLMYLKDRCVGEAVDVVYHHQMKLICIIWILLSCHLMKVELD